MLKAVSLADNENKDFSDFKINQKKINWWE